MKKSKTLYIILGVVAAVAVVGTVAFATNPELFQGRSFRSFFSRTAKTTTVPKIEKLDYFVFRDNPVTVVTTPVTSPVTTPVTTPVTSEVVSDGGPSQVTSPVTTPVTSPVTSPVASGVPVSPEMAKKLNINTLPKLTSKVLDAIAKKDWVKNPTKYELSNIEKLKLIKLYEGMDSVMRDQEKLMKDVDAGIIKLDMVNMDVVMLKLK